MSTLVPLAFQGSKCLYGWATKLPHERRKVAVVIPRRCGKTSLVRELESTNKDVLLVDLDECVRASIRPQEVTKLDKMVESGDESTHRLAYYGHCRDVYEDIKKRWLSKKTRRLIVLCSDIELAKDLFKVESIFVCIPSHSLFENVKKHADDIVDAVERSRISLISQLDKSHYTVYSSFEQLQAFIRDTFGLGNRL